MGASQSKRHNSTLGLGESNLSSTPCRKTRLVSCSETGGTGHLVSKQSRSHLNSRRSRLRGLRRSWPGRGKRSRGAQSLEVSLGSVPTPWLDKPQQQRALFSHDEASADGFSPMGVGESVDVMGGTDEEFEGDCTGEPEEFLARSVHLPKDSGRNATLLRAYANWLGYMEEDVVTALGRHPCPHEALSLMYVCCSPEPLPVEHTLEPSSDVLAYVLPGTYIKVLDFTAYSTQMECLLRLKTAEGWVTGASIQMMRMPYSSRFVASRASSAESFATKAGSQHSSASTTKPAAMFSNVHQPGDPGAHLRVKGCISPGDTQEVGDGPLGADDSRHVEDTFPSTCWGTVNACRAARFCSFQACASQPGDRACYSNLTKLASASAMQRFATTLLDTAPGLVSDTEKTQVRKMPYSSIAVTAQPETSPMPLSNRSGGMSPVEHPFMLFRVAAHRAVPVSATPHLGSPIVGRLLHRQVFPVIDACLAYCGASCGRAGGEGGCLLSGMGCLSRGGSDVLHGAPQGNVCSRKARRHLSCLSRNRRVQLRVCTTQGWVTFDRSIEKVDECDTVYEHPVLYEIVADGYLVNVRASLEIEGPVRRTIPPATLVEVYERKVNAEGLVRLRLIDGWINERRKGTDDAGLLFAIRVGDHRAAAFVRQITAALVLLPAFCSNNSRVRTAAATWLAANAAQSAVAAAALMEDVDEALVGTALKRCPCCYCSRRNSGAETEAPKAAYASSAHDKNSQRHPGDREASTHSEKRSVALQEEGQNAADGLPSGQPPPVAGGVAPPDVPCRLRPLAAKDLLLAESPVIEPSVPEASALPCTLPRIVDDHMLSPLESGESLDGFASSQLLASYDGCIGGWWHRGRSYLEKSTNLIPDVSEVWYSANGREQGVDGLCIILSSLAKAASALPEDISPLSARCPRCAEHEGVAGEHVSGCSSRMSEHSDDEGQVARNFNLPCPLSRENDPFPFGTETVQGPSRRRPSGTADDADESRDHIGCIRKCRTSVQLSKFIRPEPGFLHYPSSPELGMGMALNHDLAVRREVLSPTDILYQFCLAAVYSSLADHREPVGPHAVYRPPVGAYLPVPYQHNLVPNGALQQPMLAAYKPQQLAIKGRLPIVNSTRCSSFSFHQPPILVVHKIEKICNGFLLRRYLHERSMLMLMNIGRACRLDKAIPNPLLKAHVPHPSQESLNEYFLFHGCTEERAGLIAISGFDFRRGGENGGKLFGVGTYFSPNASKADLYTRPTDFSARAVSITVGALHKSSPALPLMVARVGPPPTGGAAGAPPALRGNATRNVGLSGQNVAADPAANKSSGSLLFGKGAWLGGGKGNAVSTQITPALSAPCQKQRDGTTKSVKEKGGLRAACAKLTRQGSGSSGSRSKDSSGPGHQDRNQKPSSAQPTNSQQHPKTQDATGTKFQQGGCMRTFGASTGFAVPPSMRCLLLARVCLGEVYTALSPMPDARMPPNKPDPVAAKLAYDSVMAECRTRGGVVDGVEFVVFERAQALPQFIVTYSHAPHCQCAECHRQLP